MVKDEKVTTTETKNGSSIEFSLDVMCCDPTETDCKQCGTTDDLVPIIKIGPKSKPDSRFFVQTAMNTNGRDMGYIHIESLVYQAFDHDGKQVLGISMIEDGCNLVGNLIEFKGIAYCNTSDSKCVSDRTDEQSEGFYLTPFQLKGDNIAEEFKIFAEVSACPHGPNGEYCNFRDQCIYTPGRYDGQPWFPGTNNVRRRRDVDEVQSSLQVIDIYHPCKYVSEDVKVCIIDDNGEQGKGHFQVDFSVSDHTRS